MKNEQVAAKINKSVVLVKQAIRELQQTGVRDCMYFADQLDGLLLSDNGECGLIPLAEEISEKIS